MLGKNRVAPKKIPSRRWGFFVPNSAKALFSGIIKGVKPFVAVARSEVNKEKLFHFTHSLGNNAHR